jgi:transcriptional regulator with PAS, ATPase and Fis domain
MVERYNLKEDEHYAEAVRRFRKHLISDVLRACGGNRSKAARQLGTHRPTWCI